MRADPQKVEGFRERQKIYNNVDSAELEKRISDYIIYGIKVGATNYFESFDIDVDNETPLDFDGGVLKVKIT